MTQKELYVKVKDLFAQAELLKNKAGEENRAMNEDDRTNYAKYINDIKGIQEQIALMDSENELRSRHAEPVFEDGKKTGENIGERAATLNTSVEAFIRKGPKGMTPEQRSMLKMGTDETHNKPYIEIEINPALYQDPEKRTSVVVTPQYLQETELSKQFMMSKIHYGGWMEATTEIYTNSGRTMYLPYTDDAANSGALEAYGTDVVGSSTDLTISRNQLDQWPFSSTGIKVDWDDLEDSSIPLSEWLYRPLTERLMKRISTSGTTSDGSNKPKGLTNNAVVGEIVSASTTPTATDMNNHLKLVDYGYHYGPKSGWMFNSSVMFALAATVKSSTYNTEPLWQPSLAAGIPSTLYGYKYWINNDMDAIGANKKVMLFGDFSYQFNRWVGPLRIVRLVERYAELLRDGFFAYQRFDSDISMTGTTYAPFKYIRNVGT